MNLNARLRLDRLTPAQRFSLGSLIIVVLGMTVVGAWVTRQIEAGVVARTATNTALYVNSLIAGPIQDLADSPVLSAESVDRLDWLITDTPLGQEVVVFQVWDSDGHIVYSTEPALVGLQEPVAGELAEAFAGQVSASIGELEGEERVPEGVPTTNLIEIYSPVRGGGTDQVIGVAEFYYAADDLERDLAIAQRQSWLVVGGATVIIYLLLVTFVRRISDTILRQQRALRNQVRQLTELLRQNQELHDRVRKAAARTAALNERFLRRFAAELHDGPAQDISLALLRLDNVAARCAVVPSDARVLSEMERELDVIQTSLRRSLQEVRATSSGLMLPHLNGLTVAQTVEHVIRGHQRRTGALPALTLTDVPEQAPLAVKIALYRIIQEALANTGRHAPGSGVAVTVSGGADALRVEVRDDGPGFAPDLDGKNDQHIGLFGMRERAESLGGTFMATSAPSAGTTVSAVLPLVSGEPHDV